MIFLITGFIISSDRKKPAILIWNGITKTFSEELWTHYILVTRIGIAGMNNYSTSIANNKNKIFYSDLTLKLLSLTRRGT
ncbi:MAG: hypothetical protein V3V72_10550 [Ignavibacteriaceae bacterium]